MKEARNILTRSVAERLEALYREYNCRACIPPDPLQFVYHYDAPDEREIAGLIAACLAFGNVKQIAASVAGVLQKMGSPSGFIRDTGYSPSRRIFKGFRHRFAGAEELCDLLSGIARTLERHGSLRACFLQGFHHEDATVLPALTAFVDELRAGSRRKRNYLLPSPADGSACKRLNLFLRWMVRRDEVDPGVWAPFPASKLVIPLDTHMHRTALALGLTRRKQADLRTALEATEAFRSISPEDPVRYDFALTRLAMRGQSCLEDLAQRPQ